MHRSFREFSQSAFQYERIRQVVDETQKDAWIYD